MGFVWLIVLFIPLVSVFAYLNLYGLIRLYDLLIPGVFMANSGHHIAIAFIFVEFGTFQGVLFHWSLFFWIGILIQIVRYALKKSRVGFLVAYAYLLAIVLVTGILFAVNVIAINYFRTTDRAVSDTRNAEQAVKLATPTATHFVCSENATLDIMPNGSVSENRTEQHGNGVAHFGTIIGRINRETGVFTLTTEKYYTASTTDRIRSNLRDCKNVDSKTVLDLYPEYPAGVE